MYVQGLTSSPKVIKRRKEETSIAEKQLKKFQPGNRKKKTAKATLSSTFLPDRNPLVTT